MVGPATILKPHYVQGLVSHQLRGEPGERAGYILTLVSGF